MTWDNTTKAYFVLVLVLCATLISGFALQWGHRAQDRAMYELFAEQVSTNREEVAANRELMQRNTRDIEFLKQHLAIPPSEPIED